MQLVKGDIADVRPLHVHHPFIGAQAPCQLAVAHVHSVDLDRTILQHTIGEAAGGSADVHADLAFGRQREALHGFFQLEPAPADIADIVAAHFHLGILFDHFAGLVHLLLVDKDDTGHDHGLGTFTALDEAVLHQILV